MFTLAARALLLASTHSLAPNTPGPRLKYPSAPIPAESIERATAIMKSGAMYRYNYLDAEDSTVSQCEYALCQEVGHKYGLGLNSCGSAIFLSLLAAGASRDCQVATNAFTFSAVPSAIQHAGCAPLYVETLNDYTVCPDDLEAKLDANPACKMFMVSHMRGKIADMDRIVDICEKRGVTLLEDCAHALGVTYGGKPMGNFGVAACFSAQSYKVLNSGEGGFLSTNDDDIAARAMVYAGTYEALASKHMTAPPKEAMQRAAGLPNYSLRMHEVTAAIILPQFATIAPRREQYNSRYAKIADILNASPYASVPPVSPKVVPLADSIQFNLLGMNDDQVANFLDMCVSSGFPVELFGSPGNARNFRNWKFALPDVPLPRTIAVIERAIDMRLPEVLPEEDLLAIAHQTVANLETAMQDPVANNVIPTSIDIGVKV